MMTPELKTRRQWRKEKFCNVRKGEKPAANLTVHYMYRRQQIDIAPDGSMTTATTLVRREREIALYSKSQTQPYKRIGALLLRDMYCRYFVDDRKAGEYLWWHVEDDEWKHCHGYLDDDKIQKHIQGKEIYGVFGGDYTCFSAIDADYHGGDYEVFRDQLTVVLKELHGRDGWHYSFGPRGCHPIKVHPSRLTDKVRADLRQLLEDIDARHPDLRARAIAAGLRPIANWEIYPDPSQGFRLPFARNRVVFLDKPCAKLDTYIEWQIEPHYCPVEDVLAEIFKVIQPMAAAQPAQEEKEKKPKEKSEVEHVFGSLRGRYAKVLIDFWLGRNNPPDSLNCAVVLTARMMPFYFPDDPDGATDYVEGLIDDLPDISFSDRLSGGKRKVVSHIVRQAIKAAYEGNGHQQAPELSTSKLAKTFRAWESKGFSLVDRSTWQIPGLALGNDFSFSDKELDAVAYFAKILNADVQIAADATRQLLRLLAVHPTGQLSVRFVKKLLVGLGVKCGHHGKVNEYLEALCQAGWISQVAGYVPGRRGRLWQVGERMVAKCCSPSSYNNPSSASIICVPFGHDEEASQPMVGLPLPPSSYNKPPSASILVSHFDSRKPKSAEDRKRERQMEARMREIIGQSVAGVRT
jgi:hypothetical protein